MLAKHFTQQNFYQRIINTMFATLLVLAVVYCIILLSLVFSVIERKQNLLAVKDLSSQVSALEARYSNEVANINDSVLAEHNFTRIENTTFAVRKDPIASFSLLYTH
ncbi:TPA: hypothetical protein DEP94_00435 [Candidatus Nomurabacteria bacterium]|nr:hypothetical protein [Candidatus Nomurabacteria bacterium]